MAKECKTKPKDTNPCFRCLLKFEIRSFNVGQYKQRSMDVPFGTTQIPQLGRSRNNYEPSGNNNSSSSAASHSEEEIDLDPEIYPKFIILRVTAATTDELLPQPTNIKTAIVSGHEFKFSPETTERFDLPCDKARVQPLHDVAKFQDGYC
ncbi:hypothetical protein CAPTEDRAFT_192558 [Capitella teleta]|uniref:Uncharacterized protein n=1 Tax=Capitella teleta TaxID=283909 RepID=R7UAQ4_CAPTE|nr:hypothetical protein CAPTEDRAFT_192558 [Capitella teleta]|eukprot:ELU00888.1 hypothetical protein CAPTEDRAFT_192558 [Capitella teleta]